MKNYTSKFIRESYNKAVLDFLNDPYSYIDYKKGNENLVAREAEKLVRIGKDLDLDFYMICKQVSKLEKVRMNNILKMYYSNLKSIDV